MLSRTVKELKADVVMKLGLPKVMTCFTGTRKDVYCLFVTGRGIAVNEADSLHCRIWNGEEAMLYKRIRINIG